MTTPEKREGGIAYIYKGRIPGGEWHPWGRTVFYDHPAPEKYGSPEYAVYYDKRIPSWAPYALGSCILLLMALLACVVVR